MGVPRFISSGAPNFHQSSTKLTPPLETAALRLHAGSLRWLPSIPNIGHPHGDKLGLLAIAPVSRSKSQLTPASAKAAFEATA